MAQLHVKFLPFGCLNSNQNTIMFLFSTFLPREKVLRTHYLIPSLSPFLRPELNGHIVMLHKMSQRVHVAWTRCPPCQQGGFEMIYHDSGAAIGSPSNWKFKCNLIWDILLWAREFFCRKCQYSKSLRPFWRRTDYRIGRLHLAKLKGKIVLKRSRAHKFGAINLSCSEAIVFPGHSVWIWRSCRLIEFSAVFFCPLIHWQLVPVIFYLNWYSTLERILYSFRALWAPKASSKV